MNEDKVSRATSRFYIEDTTIPKLSIYAIATEIEETIVPSGIDPDVYEALSKLRPGEKFMIVSDQQEGDGPELDEDVYTYVSLDHFKMMLEVTYQYKDKAMDFRFYKCDLERVSEVIRL